MKQTAVEWLEEQIDDVYFSFQFEKEFKQAKEMEEQQLIEAHDKGFDSVQQLNDDYAIEFGEYIDSLTSEDTFNFTIKELLEIFKKEKGL